MLTGNPIAATRVISQVVDAQPELSSLDSAHMDRLTVLRSREIRPASLVNPAIPQRIADAVAALTSQQREAWVLGRVYRTPLRELSRAMDCSSTAAERHLLQAEVNLRNATGLDSGQSAAHFLKASLAIDVPEFHRRSRLRKRFIRRTLVWSIIAIVAVLLAVVVIRWTRPMAKSETTQGHSSLGHVMRI